MFDYRQNYTAYDLAFNVYGLDPNNTRKNRLLYSKQAKAMIYAKYVSSNELSLNESMDGNVKHDETTIILKTPDIGCVLPNDMLENITTGVKYIVVSISHNLNKSRFRGRYDKLKTGDLYINCRGA